MTRLTPWMKYDDIEGDWLASPLNDAAVAICHCALADWFDVPAMEVLNATDSYDRPRIRFGFTKVKPAAGYEVRLVDDRYSCAMHLELKTSEGVWVRNALYTAAKDWLDGILKGGLTYRRTPSIYVYCEIEEEVAA